MNKTSNNYNKYSPYRNEWELPEAIDISYSWNQHPNQTITSNKVKANLSNLR